MKEFKNDVDINIEDKKEKENKYIKYLKELKEINLNELNINDAGEWPFLFKIIFILFFFSMLVFGSYGIHFKNKNLQYKTAQALEEKLFTELEAKIIEASHLYPYTQQVEKMEKDFVDLVNKLPTDIEMSGLLKDINDTGVESGLDFKKIEVLNEIKENFYIEVPIEISVKGNYHSFGNFVSNVSQLPRIITLHDFRIIPIEDNLLQMTIIAKTYKYNSEQINEEEE